MIDPGVPRRRFWSDDVGGRDFCPLCGCGLINEQQTYVMLVRQDGRTEPFVVGGKAGYFCPRCPSVVLDRQGFEKYARMGMKSAGPAKFTILGLLDLATIPPEKMHLPLGAGGTLPLVRFLPDEDGGSKAVPVRKPSARKPGLKKKKRK